MELEPLNEGPCEKPVFYTFRPENADALKQCVENAFADAVYPGDGDIIVSGCPGCCGECGETHELFRGRHWREVAESEQPLQERGWGGLALLTPQAWLFYLPTFLVVSLSGGDGADNALDCVLGALTPWPPEGLDKLGGGVIDYVKLSADWFAERAFNFSGAQRECLAAYMCAVSKSDPENMEWKALASYWTERATLSMAKQGAV